MVCQPGHVVGLPLHGNQSNWVPRSDDRGRRTTFDHYRADLHERTQQEIPVSVPLRTAADGLEQCGVRGELSTNAWVRYTLFAESVDSVGIEIGRASWR